MRAQVETAYDHYLNGIECGVDSDVVNERYEAYVALVSEAYPVDQAGG